MLNVLAVRRWRLIAVVLCAAAIASILLTASHPPSAHAGQWNGCNSSGTCSYTYCNGVLTGPNGECGSYCSWQDGGLCSEGGWTENFFNYYGNGDIDGCEAARDLNNGDTVSDRCPVNNYHFNSSGDLCTSWYEGHNQILEVDSFVYRHTIYGSGHYEEYGGCP